MASEKDPQLITYIKTQTITPSICDLLVQTVRQGKMEVLNYLLEHGLDVDCKLPFSGNEPLCDYLCASARGNAKVELMKLMLQYTQSDESKVIFLRNLLGLGFDEYVQNYIHKAGKQQDLTPMLKLAFTFRVQTLCQYFISAGARLEVCPELKYGDNLSFLLTLLNWKMTALYDDFLAKESLVGSVLVKCFQEEFTQIGDIMRLCIALDSEATVQFFSEKINQLESQISPDQIQSPQHMVEFKILWQSLILLASLTKELSPDQASHLGVMLYNLSMAFYPEPSIEAEDPTASQLSVISQIRQLALALLSFAPDEPTSQRMMVSCITSVLEPGSSSLGISLEELLDRSDFQLPKRVEFISQVCHLLSVKQPHAHPLTRQLAACLQVPLTRQTVIPVSLFRPVRPAQQWYAGSFSQADNDLSAAKIAAWQSEPDMSLAERCIRVLEHTQYGTENELAVSGQIIQALAQRFNEEPEALYRYMQDQHCRYVQGPSGVPRDNLQATLRFCELMIKEQQRQELVMHPC